MSEVEAVAKGKYEYWRTDDGLLLLAAWARDGLTDEQIAQKCDVRRETISAWKKSYPNIANALKRGKEPVDVEVENMTLKLALGYYVPITKHYKLKKVLVKDGVRQEMEELKEVEEQMYIPPASVNQFFWLKNRRPDSWRDKRETETSIEVEDLTPIVDMLKDMKKNVD